MTKWVPVSASPGSQAALTLSPGSLMTDLSPLAAARGLFLTRQVSWTAKYFLATDDAFLKLFILLRGLLLYNIAIDTFTQLLLHDENRARQREF